MKAPPSASSCWLARHFGQTLLHSMVDLASVRHRKLQVRPCPVLARAFSLAEKREQPDQNHEWCRPPSLRYCERRAHRSSSQS